MLSSIALSLVLAMQAAPPSDMASLGDFDLALNAEALDCPIKATSPRLGQRVSDIVQPGNGVDDIGDDLVGEMVGIAQDCAAQHGVPQAMLENYTMYYFARLARTEAARLLTGMGIPIAPIDRAFGLQDATNPPDKFSVTEDQTADLLTLLDAAGVDLDALPDAAFDIMGFYGATLVSEQNLALQLR